MRQDRFLQRSRRFIRAIACLLPVALAIAASGVLHLVEDRDATAVYARRQAEHIAHTLNVALTDVEAIGMVASSVPRFVASQTGCEDRLRMLVRSIPALEFLMLGNGRDEIACASHAGLYHVAEHRPGWLAGMIARADSGVGPLAQDETLGPSFFPLLLRLPPSVPGGRPPFVIAGISPTWLLNHLDPLTQTLLPVAGTQVLLLTDAQGNGIGGFSANGTVYPASEPAWLRKVWASGSVGPHDVGGEGGAARRIYAVAAPGAMRTVGIGLLLAPPQEPVHASPLLISGVSIVLVAAGLLASLVLIVRRGRPWLRPAPVAVPAPVTAAPAGATPRPLRAGLPARVGWREQVVAGAAGGVLHDVGNALATVLGNLELIERAARDSPDKERLERFVKRATTALTAGASLTRHLGRLARVETWQARGADPEMAAEAIQPMVRAALGPSVDVSLAQTGQSWAVNADPLLLEAILLTFCLDLRLGVDGHMRIGIAAENRPWPLPEGGGDTLASDQVALSVTAMGGTPRASAPELTEARYASIAATAGGVIRLDTPAPAARRITLLLPRRRDMALPNAEEHPPATRAARAGNWLVLLVDDDDAVRQVTAEMLRELGHDVAEATSAADALRVCETAAGSIDLILADHAMPGTTGLDFARQLRARGIRLPIVLVSGYSERIGDVVAGGAVTAFLAKPFSIGELRSVLARLQPGEPAATARHGAE